MDALFPNIDLPERKSLLFARSRADASSAALNTLVLSIVGSTCILALLLDFRPDSVDFVNTCAPVVLAACCVLAIVSLLRANPLWMWSPLMSFLAALAVFHGLGALLYVFGDPVAIAYANEFSSCSNEELARTNILTLCGSSCVVTAFVLCGRLLKRRHLSLAPKLGTGANRFAQVATWAVIAVSLPLKYFVVLPYLLGWTDPDFILPGFLQVLGNLSPLCLFLLLYNAWSRNSLYYVPAALLLVAELTTGLLSFNKTEILSTLAIGFLGLYFPKPSKLLAVAGLSVIVPVYFVITPIVTKGRAYLAPGSVSMSDRIQALEDAWTSEEQMTARIPQGWWTRLSYSNVQAFCLRQHDAGLPGDTFNLILPSLVPRVFWHDKPMITPGFEFNQLVSGNPHSASGPGVFAEAYWNGGWPAVILASAYIGALLSCFSHVTFDHVQRRDLRWLPFGIGGLLMGSMLTEWFASAYVGGALTYVVFLIGLRTVMPASSADME